MCFTICAFIYLSVVFFFFQAEDGIRDAQESRGLGDVYKRQAPLLHTFVVADAAFEQIVVGKNQLLAADTLDTGGCLLYTSDAADDLLCVDLGGRRVIKKKKQKTHTHQQLYYTTRTQHR